MRLSAAALALVAAASSSSCYRAPVPESPAANHAPAAAAALADPLAFLPVDSELVGVVEVRQIRSSPLWQRVEPKLLAGAQATLDDVRRTCGIDPLASVRRVSFGIRLLDSTTPSAVLVVKGPNRDQVMACAARQAAARPAQLRVDRGYLVASDTTGRSHMVATFADATTFVMLFSPTPTPAALDAAMRAGVPLRESATFQGLLASVQISDPLWFVVNGNSKFLERGLLGIQPRAMMGSINVSSGLVVAGRARLDNPDHATQLANMLQPQLGAISGFVEEIAITADQADLVLRLRMTPEQVDTLVGMAGLAGP
ncbi:MAG TPA: hypothetical protein VFQ53_28940 [Kofleriaceae bacterium]|nr:hypothetical protein [Kofleriaceae bacterium]